ncbi:MAG TPA: prepilin peptidase [Solirubrobacteraceae bacterium]|jgi:Flp pilus assembly protein protease CpaA|nr:prepilin peptidase [Solirubrobacteraceae bacterium]
MKQARIVFAAVGALALVGVGVMLRLDALAITRLAILGAALGVCVRDDLHERRIPNRIVLPAALACAALSLLDGLRVSTLVVGGVLLVLLLALGLARPRWIGMGDVKLLLLMLCGLHGATPQALVFAIGLAALIAGLLTIWRGREALRLALPLAPFLAGGSLLALLI